MTLGRERHRPALRRAATAGDRCFLIGPDTPPHLSDPIKAARGCAGIGEAKA
jgi:dihydroorotase